METENILTINNLPVKIGKIPLIKYPKIIQSVQNLAAHKDLFSSMDDSMESIMQSLPQIILVATPEVIKVLHAVTDVNEEEIAQWGLDDMLKVIEALLKVNDFEYIYKTIKKAMAHLNLKKEIPEAVPAQEVSGQEINS